MAGVGVLGPVCDDESQDGMANSDGIWKWLMGLAQDRGDPVEIRLQTVKCANLEISVRAIPAETTKTEQVFEFFP